MNKIIEYEIGKYQGHPVVMRFANIRENDALDIALQLASRLSREFNAVYPVKQEDGGNELHYPRDIHKFVKGQKYRVAWISEGCNWYNSQIALTTKSFTFVKYELVGGRFDELHFVDSDNTSAVFMIGEAIFVPIEKQNGQEDSH